ncbi:MAG: tetratricopeptide repeat protein [Anaerolineae bacterium]
MPGLILCLGLALRLHGLPDKSLWFDELGTLSYVAWDTTWLDTLREPLALPSIPIPPLYFAITRLFTGLGYGEFILRWPSVLFSTLTLALTYALGKLWFDRWVGALAAFFLAIAPLHIRYAQEARSYSAMVFFSILGLYLFWRALRTGRGRWWLAFVAVSMAGLYTHLFSLLPLGVMGLFGFGIVVWRRGQAQSRFRFQGWHLAAAMGAILLAFAPMLPHILTGLASERGLGENVEPVAGGLQWKISSLVSFLRLFGAGTDLGAILYALLFLLGALFLARKQRAILGLALLWIVLPVLVVLAMPFGHRVLIRYFLFSLPVYLLVGAYGLAEVGHWLGHKLAYRQPQAGARWAGIALTGIVVAGLSLPAVAAYYREEKQNWRDATRLMVAYARPGEQIYVSDVRQMMGIRYYARRLAPDLAWLDQFPIRQVDIDSPREFSPGEEDRGWLVVPFQVRHLPEGSVAAALEGYRFLPPLVLSVDHFPKDWESIAPFNYQNMMLVRYEPSGSHGDEEKVQAWLAAGRELDATLLDANLSLGLLAYYSGEMEEAVERLARPTTWPVHQQAFFHWLLGNANRELGRWDEAIDHYEQAMEHSPNYTWLQSKIGSLYREMGDLEKAEASYRRALADDDQAPNTHFELGTLYEEMDRPALALEQYARASELAPQHAGYRARMGLIKIQLDRVETAKQDFAKAIELDPDNAWYHQLLANASLALDQAQQAAAEYEQALALNPNYRQNAHFQLQRADAYRLAGRTDEAIAAYERVLALEPDNARAAQWLEELE